MSIMRKPNLFIIGTYKSGSTSLYRYLISMKNIAGGQVKETHYLDSMVYCDLSSKSVSLDEYSSYFPNDNAEYILDGTPSYFYGNDELRSFLKNEIIQYKLIVLLRNPADRFLSYYYYLKSLKLVNEDLGQFFNHCLRHNDGRETLHTGIYKNAIKEGFYIDYLVKWKDEMECDNLKVYLTENFSESPKDTLQNICAWLGIDNEALVNITRENQTSIVKFPRLHAAVVKTCQILFTEKFRSLSIYRSLRDVYFYLAPTSSRDKSEEEIYKKLMEIYSEKNNELFNYLGKPNVWG